MTNMLPFCGVQNQTNYILCVYLSMVYLNDYSNFFCCLLALSVSGFGVGNEKVLQNKWMVHLFNFISMFFLLPLY